TDGPVAGRRTTALVSEGERPPAAERRGRRRRPIPQGGRSAPGRPDRPPGRPRWRATAFHPFGRSTLSDMAPNGTRPASRMRGGRPTPRETPLFPDGGWPVGGSARR